MSFLDHGANAGLQSTVYKALTAGVFGMMNKVSHVDADEVFTKTHMKSDRLPAIEHCQSSIFRELRLREMIFERAAEAKPAKTRRPMFGFKLRLVAMGPQPMLRLN